MIELGFAIIGVVAVVLVFAIGGFVGVSMLWGRVSSGRWWWDENTGP